ncbi:MAG: endonuclease/exonuclease/phosphatase family protein [Mycobacterium sp.]|nr:endonuclease/exonuclease/phosphatase family protein [Mycobacterium sp.]
MQDDLHPADTAVTGRQAPIGIASLNAHFGLGRDGKPFDIVDACRSLDAEVIALQEVWWPDRGCGWLEQLSSAGYHLAELPQARVRLSSAAGIRPEAGTDHGWWGVAIASSIPLFSPEPIDIGRTPLDPVGSRRALRAEVRNGTGTPISVTTAHATHYFPLAPLHHRRLARALRGATRSVVCGDFNLWGPLAGLAFRGWQRPVRGRSYPAHRPHSQIDHVFITNDLVVHGAGVLAEVGSDHRPVRVEVETGPTMCFRAADPRPNARAAVPSR